MVVSGSRATTGPRGLFQVAEADWYAPIVPLTDDPDHDYRDPASSPGGARLVFSRSVGDGSDDEYDLWTGTRTQPAGVRVTTMSGAEREAQFSPDTTRIAFTHESAGQRSVWVVDADGGNARQVRADAASPAWTPDGSGLVVEDDFVSDAPLLRLDLAAGNGDADRRHRRRPPSPTSPGAATSPTPTPTGGSCSSRRDRPRRPCSRRRPTTGG